MVKTTFYGPEGNPNFPGTPAYVKAHGGELLPEYRAVKEWEGGRALLSDVMKLFQDNGAYDQSYRNTKRQFMSKAASDMVSRGMGNLVNMPGLDLAYEREVRPEFEMGKQNRLAQAMSAMANYMASFPVIQPQQPQMIPMDSGTSPFGSSRPVGSAPAAKASAATVGSNYRGNPVAQELDRMASGGSESPFRMSWGTPMMGSSQQWQADTQGGKVDVGFASNAPFDINLAQYTPPPASMSASAQSPFRMFAGLSGPDPFLSAMRGGR